MPSLPDKPPLITVIIPTYRREDFIEETLASVFAQTFKDFEVIVINDGSPDNTATRLRPLVESGRIRYYEQKNAGQAAARNKAIDLARGQFMATIDDDDLWPPDKLEWQVDRLLKNPRAVLCYGYGETFGLKQNYRVPVEIGPQGVMGDVVVRGNPILSPGQVLLRTAAVRQLGGFDLNNRGTDDWDLWIRLSQIGEFIYENRCTLNYRVHPNAMSQNPGKMFHLGLQVLHKHVGRSPLNSKWRLWLHTRGYIGRYSSMGALGQASQLALEGRRSSALRCLASAVRFYPVLPVTRRFWRTLAGCIRPRPDSP